MYGMNKAYTQYFNLINNQLYKHYNDDSTTGYKICDNDLPSVEYCSFSNLTYAQWLNQSVLTNPLTN